MSGIIVAALFQIWIILTIIIGTTVEVKWLLEHVRLI